MNTEGSKINEPHRFRLTLADKPDLKDPNKNMALANLSIYYIWKDIKSAYKNSKFKISAPTWNDEFDLPDDGIGWDGWCLIFYFQTFKIILNTSLKN